MSWTAYEYLHQVLLLNKTSLPATAQVGSLVLSFAFCCLCFIVWSSTYLVCNCLLQCFVRRICITSEGIHDLWNIVSKALNKACLNCTPSCVDLVDFLLNGLVLLLALSMFVCRCQLGTHDASIASLMCVLQFVLRYCNFLSLTMPGQAYDELLSEADLAMLPWLYRFQVYFVYLACTWMPLLAETEGRSLLPVL